MTTTIYLVRHGETDFNREGIYQGTLDIPLNALGQWQALSLARRLSRVSFDAVYSSPLKRAKATADLIVHESRRGCIYTEANRKLHAAKRRNRVLSSSVTVIPELREISYGGWQGLSDTARQLANPQLEREWQVTPWSVRFPGGESLDDVYTRVVATLEMLVSKHRDQTILISAHGHVNRIILMYFFRLDHGLFWKIEQPNGCCYPFTIRY